MIPTSNKGRFALLLGVAIIIPLCNFAPEFLSASFSSSASVSSSSSSLSSSSSFSSSSSSSSSSAWDKPESQRVDGASEHLQKLSAYEANLPLFEAVKQNDLKRVRELLLSDQEEAEAEGGGGGGNDNGFDVNAEDPRGITPLIEATLLGSTPLVELLLSRGAAAQPSPGFRHTPLRAACLTANVPLIALLLDRGADPNAASEGGRTPLMGACFLRPEVVDDEEDGGRAKSLAAVKWMLDDERTDPTIRNGFGESALDLCRERGYEESARYLEMRVEEWERERERERAGVEEKRGDETAKVEKVEKVDNVEKVAEDKRRSLKYQLRR